MRALIDARLASTMRDYFPDKCDIQAPQYAKEGSGQMVFTGEYVDLAGCTSLECRLGPLILIRPTDREVRTSKINSKYEDRQLKLNGFFPSIQVGMYAVVKKGSVTERFPIVGIEHDGNRFSSRLKLEVVTP